MEKLLKQYIVVFLATEFLCSINKIYTVNKIFSILFVQDFAKKNQNYLFKIKFGNRLEFHDDVHFFCFETKVPLFSEIVC